jgi:hypothetical protein
MKHMPEWLKNVIGEEIPIQFVASGDPYHYIY